ncbi:MAG: gliding motility-associated C-terminal domain-containing protein [Salibacteraceae bacterium]
MQQRSHPRLLRIFIGFVFGFIWCCSLDECKAQVRFHKTFPGYNIGPFPNIEVLTDGGWIVAAAGSSPPGSTTIGVALLRYDRYGNLKWSRALTTPNDGLQFSDLKVDSRGNYLVAGYYGSNAPFKSFLAYISSTGNLLWHRVSQTQEEEFTYSVVEATDGNFAIFGIQRPNASSNGKGFIVKIDRQGNVLWSNHYFQAGIWGEMIATSDGGYLCRTGVLIYKVAANGSLDWGLNTNVSPTGSPIEVNDGYIYPWYGGGIGSLVKMDKTGNLLWSSQAASVTETHRLVQTATGNLLVVGNYNFGTTNELVFAEFDPNGQFVKANRFNNLNAPLGYRNTHTALHPDGGVVVCGTNGSSPAGPMFMVKTNANWEVGCSDTPDTATTPSIVPFLTPTTTTVQTIPFPMQTESFTISNLNLLENTECYSCDSIVLELGNDTVVCPDSSFVIRPQLQNAFDIIWSTGANSDTLVPDSTGWYWLEARSLCDTVIDSIWVEIPARLQPKISASPKEGSPFDPFFIQNLSENNAPFEWVLSDGGTANTDEFYHTFNENGRHTITLWQEDTHGCRYWDSTFVEVKFLAYYLPNAFSPNGDGDNDRFGPIADGITDYELQVFNRWGEQLFVGQNQPWDGQHYSVPAPQGVYVYRLRIQTIIGDIQYPQGSFTLIR